MDIDHVPPLRAGDPLRAYFPTGTQIREHRDGLTVQDSGTGQMTGRTYRYQRSSILEGRTQDEEPLVKDIIITGEVRYDPAVPPRQFTLVRRVILLGVSLTLLVEFDLGMVSSASRKNMFVFYHLS
jgi:hypothetical protein